ncbi:hypothetical protein Poli38472_008079 [Pythium oligandrum]|uniref:Transmembrane protein n=1 Tax=Pythium oligandrum TaxID=41045 RepID=A0A8K1CL27_PYTOL|nr:hypothetical protein Poli38472_008079 [Pythium oligandrum]|eukprot:TMW65437.1 hypothetical protein Poli38472_008079 [Pythium oligandrum]
MHAQVPERQGVVLFEDPELRNYDQPRQYYGHHEPHKYQGHNEAPSYYDQTHPHAHYAYNQPPDYFGPHELSNPPSDLGRTVSIPTSSYHSYNQQQYQHQYQHQYQPQTFEEPIKPPPISTFGAAASNNSAFRPGGPVNLFSRPHVGYLLNWLLIGFFNGAIPALVYPLFGVYFNLKAYQGNAIVALLEFGWNFKFIFSFLTDGAPINRRRRKPYLYIGWGILTVLLLVFTLRPQAEPYMRDGVVLNADAESTSMHYVGPLILMSFARIMVITACEGMMVEFAQREGEMERGRTQGITLMTRGIGQVMGIVLIAFGSFGPDFGGSYAHSLPLRATFAIWTVLSFAGLLVTKFLLTEQPVSSSAQPFASQVQRIWRIIQQRTTWQIMLFGFFQNAVMTLSYHEKNAFYRMRLNANTQSLNMSDALGAAGSVFAAYLLIRKWLNTNWRHLMLWSFLLGMILEVPIETLTVFNKLPSNVLFPLKNFLVAIPYSLVAFTREFVIIEITDPGHEAATFGFITTVHYLAKPFATMLNTVIATDQKDLENDTNEMRWQIATELWAVFVLRVVVLLAIARLLPRQKRHALERKLRSDPNLIVPLVLFLCVVAVFCTVVTASVLAVFPSTSCLKFAGGDGCN